MNHISGFKDSRNIIIKDGIPVFYYTGDSYLEKLKNGISLVTLFEIETFCITVKEINNTKNVDELKQNELKQNELKYYYYETDDTYDNDFSIFPKIRKGKWNKQKHFHCKKFKKNKSKQDGYSYKLYDREQLTIDYIIKNDYNYEDDYDFYDDYDDYDDISDYDLSYSIDSNYRTRRFKQIYYHEYGDW